MYYSDNIGIIIKSFRCKKKISQNELSEGICSAKQIYRIEKGESNTTSFLLKGLSNKLGENVSRYLLMSHCSDPVFAVKIFDKLEYNLINLRYKRVLSIINNIPISNLSDFEFNDTKQLLTWYEYVALSNLGIKIITENDYLHILRFTTNKSISDLCSSNPTSSELRIIHSVISLYCKEQHFDKAEPLLKSLIKNIEEKYVDIDITLITQLLYNLARLYYHQSKYSKSLYYSNKGIRYCKRNNILIPLLDFYYVMGKSYEEIGNIPYALKYFNRFICLCNIQSNPKYTIKAKSALIEKYSNNFIDI